MHGVTYDGQNVWFAAGDKLIAFDPASGKTLRSIDVAAHAGTAFDGQHLFQIAEDRIQKIDPKTGRVLATIPAPGGGGDSGLTWAEGTLWVGQYRDRKIHQIDPETGAILRTIESNRFVTGVTWVDGELWHGTWEGDESDLRRVDPRTGEVLEKLEMPPGVNVSGLESDGGDQFFCGGGRSREGEDRPPAQVTPTPPLSIRGSTEREPTTSFLLHRYRGTIAFSLGAAHHYQYAPTPQPCVTVCPAPRQAPPHFFPEAQCGRKLLPRVDRVAVSRIELRIGDRHRPPQRGLRGRQILSFLLDHTEVDERHHERRVVLPEVQFLDGQQTPRHSPAASKSPDRRARVARASSGPATSRWLGPRAST